MHPILISIGSFHLPTYGTLLVLAILSAVYTIVRLGRREGQDAGMLLDFTTWMLLVALVGAKVLMVISDWSFYRQNPGEIFSTATLMAGGVFYGGFLAAVLFAIWYVRVNRLPFWKLADIFAPAIVLGQSVGRLGCFAGGCDYGKPTTSRLAVVFTSAYAHEISGVPLGIPLHPTQIYESLATFCIFGILLWQFRRKQWDGQIFLLYLALYGVARFFIEFLRGDEDRGFVFNHLLSTSQFIALLAILTAAFLGVRLRREGGNPRGERRAAADGNEPAGKTTARGDTAQELQPTAVAPAPKRLRR